MFFSEDESSSNVDDAEENEAEEESENEFDEDEETMEPELGDLSINQRSTTSSSNRQSNRPTQPSHPLQWAFRNQQARAGNEEASPGPSTTTGKRKEPRRRVRLKVCQLGLHPYCLLQCFREGAGEGTKAHGNSRNCGLGKGVGGFRVDT